jgi:hypothetical protein
MNRISRLTAVTATAAALIAGTVTPALANSDTKGSFTMRCTTSGGQPVANVTLEYLYPRTVGKNVVQTYQTVKVTPVDVNVTAAKGKLSMYLGSTKAASSKSFSVKPNRSSSLNWKLSVPENRTLSVTFDGALTLTSRAGVKTTAVCRQS